MNVSEKINEAIKNWLNSMDLNCDSVQHLDESVYYGSCGYDTCSYEDWSISISYKSNGETKFYDFEGKFSELINILDAHS